jgi:hypothetical protein
MASQIDVERSHAFNGSPKRIYQLLCDLGSSADAVWPFASQPFMRTAGPLEVGKSEEWHGGVHGILAELEPETKIVWRFLNDGIDGTHGFYLAVVGKKTQVTHRVTAVLDRNGEALWKRLADANERQVDGIFEKMTRVLKR